MRDEILWRRVEEIVGRAPDTAALRWHRVELLDACAGPQRDGAVDPELQRSRRLAACRALAATPLLRLVEQAVDGPVLLVKGPEVAAHYPNPAARPFKDLDLLVPDPERAQRDLLQAGFVELLGDAHAPTPYHLRTLGWRGLPLTVELHATPHSPRGLVPPSIERLLVHARPSRTGVPGIRTLHPAAHAVLVALHAWAHGPLERLGHLVDVAVLLEPEDRPLAGRVADDWGCQGLWRTTVDAIDALLLGGSPNVALRLWSRDVRACRERTLLESHLVSLVAPVWAGNSPRSLGGTLQRLAAVSRPDTAESWSDKLRRSRRALAHGLTPVAEYRSMVATEADSDVSAAA
jgi:Uncharacterised nucleotidyltransferase